MKKRTSSNLFRQSSDIGGVETAAKIMNLVKVDMASDILKDVSNIDEDLALEIQDNMFTFNTLAVVDNRAVQVILRNVNSETLMRALKGADEEAREKFLRNMSQRARIRFLDDMEALGPMRSADAEMAQKEITRAARKLADSGDIALAINRDEFI